MDLYEFWIFLFNFHFIRTFAIFHCAFATGNVTSHLDAFACNNNNDLLMCSRTPICNGFFPHSRRTPARVQKQLCNFISMKNWFLTKLNMPWHERNNMPQQSVKLKLQLSICSHAYMYICICVLHIVVGRFLFPLSLHVRRKFEICAQLSIQLLHSIFN